MALNPTDLSVLRSNYMELNNLVNERAQLAKSKRGGGQRINEIDTKLQDLCIRSETLLQKGEIDTKDPSTVWVSQLKDRIKSLKPKMQASQSSELAQGLAHISRKTMDIQRSQTRSSTEESEEEKPPLPPQRSIEPKK